MGSETVGDGESGGVGLGSGGQPVTEGLEDGVGWSFSFPPTLGLCEVLLNTEEPLHSVGQSKDILRASALRQEGGCLRLS